MTYRTAAEKHIGDGHMFVWSLKTSKRELIIIGVGVLAFIITAVLLLASPGSRSASALADSGYTLSADGADERLAFLSQFGWQCDAEPVSVKEVIIPAKFNDVYEQYNQLQLRQGFDLQALSGRRVKLWTYRVTNYPGSTGDVVANLLVLDGRVVGGDISSTLLDGFMHGFDPNAFAGDTAAAQQTAASIDRTVPDSIPADSEVPPEADE